MANYFEVRRFELRRCKKFRVGDIINFQLRSGDWVKAIMMRNESNGAVFCFRDCVSEQFSMGITDTNNGGYMYSLIRRVLNSILIKQFPDDVAKYMQPFENGDFLRIPSEKEVTGMNLFGIEESPDVSLWKPMRDKRNLIAFMRTNTGNFTSYWLMNAAKDSGKSFCYINELGIVDTEYPTELKGVRPVFKLLLNSRKQWETDDD